MADLNEETKTNIKEIKHYLPSHIELWNTPFWNPHEYASSSRNPNTHRTATTRILRQCATSLSPNQMFPGAGSRRNAPHLAAASLYALSLLTSERRCSTSGFIPAVLRLRRTNFQEKRFACQIGTGYAWWGDVRMKRRRAHQIYAWVDDKVAST